jgi:hypothetical protein
LAKYTHIDVLKPTHFASTFKSRTSNATPKLLKELAKPTKEKIELKKTSLLKNFKNATAQPTQMTAKATTYRTPAGNTGLAKVAVQCFVGQFCEYINLSASYESWC